MPDLRCRECGAPLSSDEFALTRKMINRASQEGFCLPCLARHFLARLRIRIEKMLHGQPPDFLPPFEPWNYRFPAAPGCQKLSGILRISDGSG